MKPLLRCMTSSSTEWPLTSFGLLLFRVALCCGLLTHGLPKIQNFNTLRETFPDPIHAGPAVALCLVIFAEVICSLLVMLGLFTRLSALPPLIMMIVAVFVFHANDPFQAKEPALFYLSGFSLLFLVGPGYFSIDGILSRIFARTKVSGVN